MLLEFEGFRVYTCENVFCALDLAGKKSFEIFIVDYLMPEMNGDEATKRIRQLSPHSFIIGYSIEEKEQVFLHAGANAFLAKGELLERLVPLIENRNTIV